MEPEKKVLRGLTKDLVKLDELDLEIKRLENERDREISAVRKGYDPRINKLKEKQKELAECLLGVVTLDHRSVLDREFRGKKKFDFLAGVIRLYLSPNPKLLEADEESLVKELRRKGLMRKFVSHKLVIHRERIKRALLDGTLKLKSAWTVQPEIFKIYLNRSHSTLSFDEEGTFRREVEKKEKKGSSAKKVDDG